MRILVWAFWALIFFTLFAFSLNNKHGAVLYGFFGLQWRAPMVIVVLAAFGLGAALGVLAMVPGWWRHRRLARSAHPATPMPKRAGRPPVDGGADAGATRPPTITPLTLDGPPREGL